MQLLSDESIWGSLLAMADRDEAITIALALGEIGWANSLVKLQAYASNVDMSASDAGLDTTFNTPALAVVEEADEKVVEEVVVEAVMVTFNDLLAAKKRISEMMTSFPLGKRHLLSALLEDEIFRIDVDLCAAGDNADLKATWTTLCALYRKLEADGDFNGVNASLDIVVEIMKILL